MREANCRYFSAGAGDVGGANTERQVGQQLPAQVTFNIERNILFLSQLGQLRFVAVGVYGKDKISESNSDQEYQRGKGAKNPFHCFH